MKNYSLRGAKRPKVIPITSNIMLNKFSIRIPLKKTRVRANKPSQPAMRNELAIQNNKTKIGINQKI